MIPIETVLWWLREYRYLAMFLAIFLSALGLPLPEEVTLIASGLAVGWDEADFVLASLACIAGILASDAFNFAMGRYCGRWFLRRRLVRVMLTPRRQRRIRRLFDRHGTTAVFLSRFVPVLRLGVHAYAGQHGIGWGKFLLLDSAGAVISGPLTILVGVCAARQLADPERAAEHAQSVVAGGSAWIWTAIAVAVVAIAVHRLWHRRAPAAPPRCTST